MAYELPGWAAEMREVFRSGTTSQFVLYGSVFDLVPGDDGKGGRTYLSLRRFLTEVMFAPFDVVILYDRGKGIRVRKGGDHFHRFLKAFDTFQGTSWAGLPDVGPDKVESLDLGNLLPRDPKRALELIDRFLRGALARTRLVDGKPVPDPLKVAVIIDYAHYIAPQGEPLVHLRPVPDAHPDPGLVDRSGDHRRLRGHGPDHREPRGPQPPAGGEPLQRQDPDPAARGGRAEGVRRRHHRRHRRLRAVCEVPREILAERLVGLSRVNVRNLIQRAVSAARRSPASTSPG